MLREMVRRSNLVVSPLDRSAVETAWTDNADAVTLDLAGVPRREHPQVAPAIRDCLAPLGKGGAEVFVRVSLEFLSADIEAAVWPGVAGILLSYPESGAAVQEADEAISAMERRHAVERHSVELALLLGTARAVWDLRRIIASSPRVTMVGLDERHLALSLGAVPTPALDPFTHYARGRVIVEAAGADEGRYGRYGVHRFGIGFPLSCLPRADAPPEEVYRAAKEAKELGISGSLCLHPSWVEPCNRAFTPTDEEIAFHRKVREVYAQAVAQGRGAMPIGGGRFVERPTDELAEAMIALRERCDRRDAAKAAARGSNGRQ